MEKRFGVGFHQLRGTALASGMNVPLLVIHDLEDREVPQDEGRSLVAAWPGSRLMATIGLGHNRILGDRSVADAAARFVTDGAAQIP